MIQNIWITNAAGSAHFSPKRAENCKECALIRITNYDEYAKEGFRPLQYEKEFFRIGEWLFDDDPEGWEFAMQEKHALGIKAFVDDVKDQVNTLLIHCDAGQSRSAAVGLSVARYLGLHSIAEEICSIPAYKPNPWVRKLTGQIFGVEPTREEYQILLDKLWGGK